MENLEEDYEFQDGPDEITDTIDTGWDNAPTVADLKQDLTDAQTDHDSHVSNVDTWLDNLNITGAAKIPKKKGKSSVVPKLIRKQAEWRYSSLSEPFLSTEDIFNTAPVTYEDKKAAIQNGLVLNSQFNTKIQKVAFIDEYIRTAVDEGTVIVRVGWDFEEEEQEVSIPIFNYQPATDPDQMMQIFQEMEQMMQESPEKLKYEVPEEMKQAYQLTLQSSVPMEPVQVGVEVEMQMITLKNQPTLEVCDYNNVIIDPSCRGDLTKAEFVIYSFETSLSELEKDGKYTNLSQINVDANSIYSSSDHSVEDESSFNFKDKPRTKFVAYEYWGFRDIDGDGITKPIVATWVGDVMIRMEENPYPDQAIPFISAQYLPVRKSIYGEPDGELLEDNQKIVGAVTRGMIDVMGRSANGQQGSRKDALDITNKRKFDKGLDYEYNQGVDPRLAFHMHTFPEIPHSAELMLGIQNAEAESLTGVKAFSSGLSGQALGNTATGIRSALDATSKRELGILRRMAEGIKQIGRKMTAMNAVFLGDEEVFRITNDEFISIKRDDLTGSIDITLSISTAEADEAKAQELAFMLQTMGNSMPAEMSQMVLAEIARLRKMPTLARSIESYAPEPDPIMVEREQLTNELLKAQIENELAKANENNANAVWDQTRAAAEQVNAGKVQSETDKNNLDYVEQESGVTQERDLEKSSQQAKSNMALEVVKSQLKQKENADKEGRAKTKSLKNI